MIGDDGIEGIQLGDDYPGVAYKAFQRSLLSLMDRGILLAVVSKNDQGVVEEVFRELGEQYGRLDVLVNNAGIPGPTAAVEDIAVDDWLQTIDVDLTPR